MDWYDLTDEAHGRSLEHERLDALPDERDRELAALWRLEADVNNGAYLQFIGNWGRETYEYAARALRRIGALRMAEIVEGCQALVEEHVDPTGMDFHELCAALPEPVVQRIYDLSYEFMDYPDDLSELGLRYYVAKPGPSEGGA